MCLMSRAHFIIKDDEEGDAGKLINEVMGMCLLTCNISTPQNGKPRGTKTHFFFLIFCSFLFFSFNTALPLLPTLTVPCVSSKPFPHWDSTPSSLFFICMFAKHFDWLSRTSLSWSPLKHWVPFGLTVLTVLCSGEGFFQKWLELSGGSLPFPRFQAGVKPVARCRLTFIYLPGAAEALTL